jgi:hypothetical protein
VQNVVQGILFGDINHSYEHVYNSFWQHQLQLMNMFTFHIDLPQIPRIATGLRTIPDTFELALRHQ